MPVPSANFAEAVALARPGAHFKLDPESYAGLTMLDGTPKPTLAEIEAAWENRESPRPVYSVAMGSLRRALGRTRCIQISAWIGGIQDVDQRHALSSWWEYSPTVRSSHPAIPTFQQVLGLTDDQADAIFAAAYAEDNL
jgi:hypothetical protein